MAPEHYSCPDMFRSCLAVHLGEATNRGQRGSFAVAARNYTPWPVTVLCAVMIGWLAYEIFAGMMH